MSWLTSLEEADAEFNDSRPAVKQNFTVEWHVKQKTSMDFLLPMLEEVRDINARVEDHTTLICIAIRWGNEEVIDYCLSRGADLNLINADGSTALSLALDDPFHEVIPKLVAGGANMSAVFWNGSIKLSALEYVIRNIIRTSTEFSQWIQVSCALVELGHDVHIRIDTGGIHRNSSIIGMYLMFMFEQSIQFGQVVERLLDRGAKLTEPGLAPSPIQGQLDQLRSYHCLTRRYSNLGLRGVQLMEKWLRVVMRGRRVYPFDFAIESARQQEVNNVPRYLLDQGFAHTDDLWLSESPFRFNYIAPLLTYTRFKQVVLQRIYPIDSYDENTKSPIYRCLYNGDNILRVALLLQQKVEIKSVFGRRSFCEVFAEYAEKRWQTYYSQYNNHAPSKHEMYLLAKIDIILYNRHLMEVCFGLQTLQLPLLLLIAIIDELLPYKSIVDFGARWNVVAAIAHFRGPYQ